jgi:hypothetical protein
MNENVNAPKADAQGEKLDAILSALSNLAYRVDSMEKNLPAPPLVTAADKKKAKKDDDDAMCDDDEEESESEAKKFMERKMDAKKRKDDDDDRMDAEGSDPKEHGKAGEMKPDDEGKVEHPGHMEFKKDDDDDDDDDDKKMSKKDEEAMKMDEEEAKYADAQAKADSVFASFGKSASRPLQGESLIAYRKRLLRGLQAYSDTYKDVNLLKEIKGEKMLTIAEKQIFNDALKAAKSPTLYANDAEYEIKERDASGRTITKFKGGFGWLDAFKVPAQRVKEFNLNNFKR